MRSWLAPYGEERGNATRLEPLVQAHGIRRKIPERSRAYPVSVDHDGTIVASWFETPRNARAPHHEGLTDNG